ncbi:MAG: flippase [Alicyclobacillus sp.]|nr:flippase [Alicyclobacillus sp.]
MSRILRHPVFQNVVALYGVNLGNYVFPLITTPYLARVLGPEEWGVIAFTQAFAQYINLIVEYGFDLSGTREVARTRGLTQQHGDLNAGVLGAKVVLTFLVVALVLVGFPWIPLFLGHVVEGWAGVFLGIAMSFMPRWYFQGTENMRWSALLDVGARIMALIGILVFVHHPSDGWKVLGVQGVGALVSTMAAFALLYREVPFRWPKWASVSETLRLGWTMFLFRSSVGLYTTGNALILGFFAPPQAVAYYAGAEKISKAFLGLLGPISQALYPRLSYLAHSSQAAAKKLLRLSFIVMGLGGAVMGLMVYVSAPVLVRVLLGDGYEPAVVVLRLLALLPPLIALSNVLGIQWMVPLGLDSTFNAIILVAGFLNVCIAIVAAPHFAHIGMALSVVVSEAFVTMEMYLVLRRKHLDPFSNK